MKKILLPLVAGLAAIESAQAVDLRQYVSLKISDVLSGTFDTEYNNGIQWVHEDFKTKEFWGGSLAYGVKLANFRVELEANAYSNAKLKHTSGVNVQNKSLFVNGYYDIQTNSLFVPYIGMGFGYNRISVNEPGWPDEDSATLAIKAAFGVAWQINDIFALDMGYRYNYFGNISENDYDTDLSGHELTLGARFSF